MVLGVLTRQLNIWRGALMRTHNTCNKTHVIAQNTHNGRLRASTSAKNASLALGAVTSDSDGCSFPHDGSAWWRALMVTGLLHRHHGHWTVLLSLHDGLPWWTVRTMQTRAMPGGIEVREVQIFNQLFHFRVWYFYQRILIENAVLGRFHSCHFRLKCIVY